MDHRDRETPQMTKERLVPGSINVQLHKKKFSRSILSWCVPRFTELKINVLYFHVYNNTDMNCILKLIRTKRVLYLCLRSGKLWNKRAEIAIIDEANGNSLTMQSTEITGGLHVAHFKNDSLLSPDCNYLNDNILNVSFRFQIVEDSKSFVSVDPYKEEPIADPNELQENKTRFVESLFPAFLIHAGDYTFKTHKLVLASGSKFFDDLLTANATVQEYTAMFKPGIMHEVLLYMYGGELKEFNMECMLAICDVAYSLRIDTLIERCLCFIGEHIEENNLDQVCALTDKLDSAALRNIVNQYKQRRPQ